ncbi:MAG TPA: hypothetical protein VED63_12750, partial [Acidimicrobiales bacterium]|nr:hypothetical protein [Acidimicrobiales bacterium]
APFLGRWLDPAESRRVAEWATRIVISYLACPADGVDMADPDQVRALVRRFVLPGIRALGAPGLPDRVHPASLVPLAREPTDSTKGAAS